MLTLLFFWIIIGWLCLVFGIGTFDSVFKLRGERDRNIARIAPDYLLLAGFVSVTTIAGFLSLVSPIHFKVQLLFVLFGFALTIRYQTLLRGVLADTLQQFQEMPWPFKVPVMLVIGLALLACGISFEGSDTCFYHTQAIQWIRNYAVVPGLGNLHGRFAFNSHYFISTALFSFFYSEDQILFPLLSFFFGVFLIRLLVNISRATRRGDWYFIIFYGLILAAFAYQTILQLSNTSTDAIVHLLLYYVFLLFLEHGYKAEDPAGQVYLIVALLCTAVTFKLSAVWILILLPFLFPLFQNWRSVAVLAGTGVLIVLPFLVRNVALSGYLVYPEPAIDWFNVDWKIPIEEVQYEKDLVEGWAKQPYGMENGMGFDDMTSSLNWTFKEWFWKWWPEQSLRWRAIMIVDLFLVALLIVAIKKRRKVLAVLSFTLLISLAYWFLNVPEPRFAHAPLFTAFALIIAEVATPVLQRFKPGNKVLFVCSLFLLTLPVLQRNLSFVSDPGVELLWCPRHPIKAHTTTFRAGNFILNIPNRRPPGNTFFCNNASLPCTPFPKTNLMMRGQTLQDGFYMKEHSLITGESEVVGAERD
ncbi:MAG: hypothetical protein EP344_18195 [Bacteroidetes bacterium]|nr:MAG: hypothetical protein EP344_18195 [Bacteroidota bacterium]